MHDPQIVVSYAGIRLLFTAPDEVTAAVQRELEPFFTFGEPGGDSRPYLGALRIHLSSFPAHQRPAGGGSDVVVDTSLYKHLASTGARWGDESRYVIHIRVSDTWVAFDKPSRQMDLYHADPRACVLETVRLVKGVFMPALERSGAVQLHGSAVVSHEECVLILGDMWHGKTTLLLELLSQFNVAQLSCDTVTLSTGGNGATIVTGWPSPFSVSHGTMADFPELYPSFPADRRAVGYARLWEEGRKEILTSSDVVERFGTHLEPRCARLAICLLVRFAPGEPTRIEPVTTAEALEAFLQTVYLGSRDPIYHNWHQFLVCDPDSIDTSISAWAQRLAAIDTYRMTWAPSAVSLMKRIPRLARAHKHLSQLLDAAEGSR